MTEYSHAIPIEHNLPPGPLWEYKHNAEELEELEKSDPYNYSAQYGQDPTKRGGSIFLTEWWEYYQVVPDYEWKAIFGDTALKDKEINDYSVFQCWAKYKNRIYLLDQWRARVKSTELEKVFTSFWNNHVGNPAQPLRAAYIEDKASGTQLIQQIQKNGGIPIIPVPRVKSKVERAVNNAPWIKSGLLVLPDPKSKNAPPWIYDFVTEFERFSPLMTHKFDDQIDATLDAIENMLVLSTEYKPPDDAGKPSTAIAPTKGAKLW